MVIIESSVIRSQVVVSILIWFMHLFDRRVAAAYIAFGHLRGV